MALKAELENHRAANLVEDILLIALGEQAGIYKQRTQKQLGKFLDLQSGRIFRQLQRAYADSIAKTDKELGRQVAELIAPENLTKRKGSIFIKQSAQKDFLKWSEAVWGKKVSRKILSDIGDVTERTYKAGKSFTSRAAKVPTTFETVDRQALKALDAQFSGWISTDYGRVRTPVVSKIVAQGFKESIRTESIAIRLEEQLGNTYADYRSWNQLASYQVNMARNIGQVFTYQEAGITIVEYAPVMDARTTLFCQELDGKVVTVESLSTHTDQLLSITDPEQLIDFKPFVNTAASDKLPRRQFELSNGRRLTIPRGNDAVRNSAALSRAGVLLSPFHHLCYAKGTEVLTEGGWIKFEDVRGTENFASLNPKSHQIEYVKGTRKVEYFYNGDMIHFKNRNFDLLVTPDHQMAYVSSWQYKNGSRRVKLRSAASMADSDVIPRTGKWIGEDRESITIGDKSYSTGPFMDFMGWYISEGHIQDKSRNKDKSLWTIKISQEKDVDSIRLILATSKKLFDEHFKVTVSTDGILISGKDRDIFDYLKKLGYGYEKYIPKELKDLQPKYLRRLLRTFYYGDGTVRDNKSINDVKGGKWVANFKPTRICSTSSPKLADDVGELILKCGKLPSFYELAKKGTVTKHWNGTYSSNHDIIGVAELNSKNKIFKKKDRSIVKGYSDNVHCVELSKNHILYVRSNGRCTWSGNCRTTTIISLAKSLYAMGWNPSIQTEQSLLKTISERLKIFRG